MTETVMAHDKRTYDLLTALGLNPNRLTEVHLEIKALEPVKVTKAVGDPDASKELEYDPEQ